MKHTQIDTRFLFEFIVERGVYMMHIPSSKYPKAHEICDSEGRLLARMPNKEETINTAYKAIVSKLERVT